MKTQIVTIVAATILALIAGNTLINNKSAQQENVLVFEQWIQKEGKVYSSPAEKSYRLSVFSKTKAEVERVNSSQEGYKFGLNKFSDMTKEEFKAKYLGYKADLNSDYDVSDYQGYEQPPASIDWSKKGAVTNVKDQGQCGSCWAFSATGTLEGAWFLAKGELLSFSEQQLVDCSWLQGNMGCHGGLPDNAFKYYEHKGFLKESDYWYNATDGHCQYESKKSKIIGHLHTFKKNGETESDLMASVALRPTSVGVLADPWMNYMGGIYSNVQECPAKKRFIDHAVLAVGYGTDEKGVDFWLIKNSWGPNWGERGYIRLGRNLTAGGMCGVALETSYIANFK